MVENKNVTVVIPVKNRVQYVIRLLLYMNHVSFPFKVVVADGGNCGLGDTIKNSFADFDNFNMEYLQFPFDKDLTSFYNKLSTTLERVDTPLTIVLDDDELLYVDGLVRSTEFLRRNPSYASARGAVRRLFFDQDYAGTMSLGDNIYEEYPSVTGTSAYDRAYNYAKMCHSSWHNLTWTNVSRTIYSIIALANPSNMRFATQMSDFMNASFGNEFRDTFPYVLHQENSLEVEGKAGHFVAQEDWIKSDHWPENFARMADSMAAVLSYLDGCSVVKARQQFIVAYLEKLPLLKGNVTLRIADSIKKYGSVSNKDLVKGCYEIMHKNDVSARNISAVEDYPFIETAEKETELMRVFFSKLNFTVGEE